MSLRERGEERKGDICPQLLQLKVAIPLKTFTPSYSQLISFFALVVENCLLGVQYLHTK
jgi:hypothetical protein